MGRKAGTGSLQWRGQPAGSGETLEEFAIREGVAVETVFNGCGFCASDAGMNDTSNPRFRMPITPVTCVLFRRLESFLRPSC